MVVTNGYDSSTGKAESGESLWIQGQHGLKNEFQDNWSCYTEKAYLGEEKNKKKVIRHAQQTYNNDYYLFLFFYFNIYHLSYYFYYLVFSVSICKGFKAWDMSRQREHIQLVKCLLLFSDPILRLSKLGSMFYIWKLFFNLGGISGSMYICWNTF